MTLQGLPIVGCGQIGDEPHVDAQQVRVVVGTANHTDAPFARVGVDEILHSVGAVVVGGLNQTPNAVAAHLGATSVGVVENHAEAIITVSGHDQQTVGPDTGSTIAHASSEIGPLRIAPLGRFRCGHLLARTFGHRTRFDNEKVVAEAMVLRERQVHRPNLTPVWRPTVGRLP